MHETTLPPASLGSLVARMAHLLSPRSGSLSSGDVSAIRRMDAQRPAASFYKLLAAVPEFDEGLPEDVERRWAAIAVGLSHLGELHQREPRLGTVLAEGGFSELRFARLLRADSEQLVDELTTLARFIAAKSLPVDWVDGARLILSAGRTDEERVRRDLARDFFRTLALRNP